METRYDSVKVTDEGLKTIQEFKEQVEKVAGFLEANAAMGREFSLALTHLQTAVMFGTHAISREFVDSEQSERQRQ